MSQRERRGREEGGRGRDIWMEGDRGGVGSGEGGWMGESEKDRDSERERQRERIRGKWGGVCVWGGEGRGLLYYEAMSGHSTDTSVTPTRQGATRSEV